MDIIIFKIYDNLSERAELRMRNIIYEQQLNLYSKHSEEQEEIMLNFRKVKHDMKNHLICLRELADNNEQEKIINYLDNLIMDNNIYIFDLSKSGNIVVDCLINYKYSVAQKQGIDFQAKIAIWYKLPFDDGDICILLGNALDNAIEATSKLNNKKKYIHVYLRCLQDVLSISIINPYEGELKKDKHGNLTTTKKHSENHGIGLSSIIKVINKYNGTITINTDNNIFTLKILLYLEKKKLPENI